MFSSNVNGGRCQCAWGQLYKIFPDELIKIVDGYTHLSEFITDAIFEEFNGPSDESDLGRYGIYRRSAPKWYSNQNTGKWIFYADTSGHYGFDMGRIGHRLDDGDADITCRLRIVCINKVKSIQITVAGIDPGKLIWDGPNLTAFANRHNFWYLHDLDGMSFAQVTGKNKNPVDLACDTAHKAIWIWFHGGDPTELI